MPKRNGHPVAAAVSALVGAGMFGYGTIVNPEVGQDLLSWTTDTWQDGCEVVADTFGKSCGGPAESGTLGHVSSLETFHVEPIVIPGEVV